MKFFRLFLLLGILCPAIAVGAKPNILLLYADELGFGDLGWPGITKAGVVSDALVSQIDFMATLAAALGYELPANAAEDSHDLLPLLKGLAESIRTSHIHDTKQNQYAIRHGKWLLIDAPTGYLSKVDKGWETRHHYQPDGKQPVELYDMENDIGQRNNLAADNPERVAELQALLGKIRGQGHSAPRLAK